MQSLSRVPGGVVVTRVLPLHDHDACHEGAGCWGVFFYLLAWN
jgi:hypothetical protein